MLITSESVTEGHPDKLCDQIADAVLDAIIKKDPQARVACEVSVGMGYMIIGGEITTKTWVDVNNLARQTIKNIGYNKPEYGFDYRTVAIFNAIHEQSPDIALGVRKTASKTQGAGDQGMCLGYATDETPELMPLPIVLAHRLCQQLAYVRKMYKIKGLRPDGKAQVTVEYDTVEQRNKETKKQTQTLKPYNLISLRPVRIEAVVIAAQHDPEIKISNLKTQISKLVIEPVLHKYGFKIDVKTKIFINNTGRFVIGGPVSDTGATGRKIIVDNYGGGIAVGGGSFSGKDPTKVDRSSAYMARYMAKNIVAAGIAKKCQLRLSYVIGGTEPLEISLDTFGTLQLPSGQAAKISEDRIIQTITKIFDLSPGGIIQQLDLLRPIYQQVACYGHFGRPELHLPWEETNKIKELQKALRYN